VVDVVVEEVVDEVVVVDDVAEEVAEVVVEPNWILSTGEATENIGAPSLLTNLISWSSFFESHNRRLKTVV
jgi:hypothetical protein